MDLPTRTQSPSVPPSAPVGPKDGWLGSSDLPAVDIDHRRIMKTRLAVTLFFMTLISTAWAGLTAWSPVEPLLLAWSDESLLLIRRLVLANWRDGMIFSLSLLGILMAHEMGHYLMTLRYRVPSTLPLFIPLPISPIGTCGAVILMDGGQADRKEIFDIGLAGPLAGLVATVPFLIYSILNSSAPHFAPYESFQIGYPPVILWLAQWLSPEWLPQHIGQFNNRIDPMMMAAWVGLLVTGVNMAPMSQLDGGHVAFGLLGEKSVWIARAFALFAVGYMIYTRQALFAVMFLLVLIFGLRHPPSRNDHRPIGLPRQILGWASLSIPFLCIPAYPLTVL